MKRLISIHLFLFLCLPTFLKAMQTIVWKDVKVLVYTKNGKGFVHDNIENSKKALQEIAASTGFKVDFSENPADFTDERLKQYDVLIFSNTNNDVFDNDKQRLALMRYIQAGGAFVGIHSASGTERNWPWFKRLLGGTFDWHEPGQAFDVLLIQQDHPSVSHLPVRWKRAKDECYYLKEMEVNLQVIAVNDLNTIDKVRERRPITFGNKFPSVWCHEFDGGRAWYTSLGHQKEDYDDAAFRKHILGGIQWAIGEQRERDYSRAKAQRVERAINQLAK
ncbi:MAG: ThuA domain-containing protein [Olivibacter sp.]|nr:ThuA domain-containing protein [Olivibacter sp. UJ_SKK_5.1]